MQLQDFVFLQPSSSPFANRHHPRSLPPSPSGLSPVKPDRVSDRFIPSRAGARWHIDFNLITENGANQNMCNKNDLQNNQQQPQPQQSAQSHTQESQVQQTNQPARKRKDTNENGKGKE